LDQHEALENQFDGMSDESFTYADYETTRERLVEKVQGSLTAKDRTFLLDFKRLEPDWSIYDYQDYPSVKWKILNLNKLKNKNPAKYKDQYNRLENFLGR